jgi:hypothetical protein
MRSEEVYHLAAQALLRHPLVSKCKDKEVDPARRARPVMLRATRTWVITIETMKLSVAVTVTEMI